MGLHPAQVLVTRVERLGCRERDRIVALLLKPSPNPTNYINALGALVPYIVGTCRVRVGFKRLSVRGLGV